MQACALVRLLLGCSTCSFFSFFFFKLTREGDTRSSTSVVSGIAQ
jgi:hypothetical protein